MASEGNSFRRKQRRTALLLTLVICLCLGGAYYVQRTSVTYVPVAPAVASQKDVELALERYEQRLGEQEVSVYSSALKTSVLKTDLLFYGACDLPTATALVTALQKSKAQAHFFLSSFEITSSKDMVTLLKDTGYSVGVLNDGTSLDMTGVAPQTAVGNLSRAGVAMQATYGIKPDTMLVFAAPDDELKRVAGAAAINEIFVAREQLTAKSIMTETAAYSLVENAHRGSALCIQLSTFDVGSADGLKWLLSALDGTDLRQTAQELVAQNDADPVEPVKVVTTTERAACFTFCGMGYDAELDAVLSALREQKAKALFYVTGAEIDAYEDEVRRIVAAGHDLGIAVQLSGSESELLEQILITQEALRTRIRYDGELPVHPWTGGVSETLRRACTSGGFTLLSAGIYAVRQQDMRQGDAAELLESIMPASTGALQRGEIVHFQMGVYQARDTMTAELVKLVATERNVYELRSIVDVLANQQYRYEYPLADADILPAVRDKVHPGQLGSDTFAEIQKRYIGAVWVDSALYLPGFTKQEVSKLDKKGIIKNSQNMVFLTFDDWGTDATLTKLLDVLKKHKAKATFFVRTNFVSGNPNLLRSIALEGHDICSHTHGHVTLSNAASDGKTYLELSQEQVEALREDIVKSYQTLQSIVGDIQINGRPALSRIFRPPTLAVSKQGMETVFDCGYSYSVSGFSTQDYYATDAESLAKLLKKNTKSGQIFVMHMSDNSRYTAEALDLYMTEMEQQAAKGKEYKFVRLTDALKE